MKKSTFLLLFIFFVVFSCDTDEVIESQEQEVIDFSLSQEETALLDDFFIELNSSPSYLEGSVEDYIYFITDFLNKKGYDVDMKNYYRGLDPNFEFDEKYQVEMSLSNEITDYVTSLEMSGDVPEKLQTYEKQIFASGNTFTKEQTQYIKSDIALWQYIYSNNALIDLYETNYNVPNARTGFGKCFWAFLKFGVKAIYYAIKCSKGDISSCAKVALDLIELNDKCKSKWNIDEYLDTCEKIQNPCCGVSCRDGYVCDNGNCVPGRDYVDPCDSCARDEKCLNGACVPR